jgi:hypothetical protein
MRLHRENALKARIKSHLLMLNNARRNQYCDAKLNRAFSASGSEFDRSWDVAPGSVMKAAPLALNSIIAEVNVSFCSHNIAT